MTVITTSQNFVNYKHNNKMKKYILNTLLLFCLMGFGQTIKPIETEWTVENTDDTYFKDVNNVLDKFVGTWRYENTLSNTIFEITFTKVIQAEGHKNGYVDELSAQFKLTVNGIEKYNTYITDCEDCFVSSRLCFYKEDEIINNRWVFTEPNVNMYVGSIAEPDFENQVLASNLKLEYQFNLGNPAQLNWTNIVSTAFTYNTGEIVNNYQMPLNMVLIKQ